MATSDLFHLDAELGSDDDESFDEETGEVKRRQKLNGTNGRVEDSSEEDEEDDDEEAEREVREGFIVDEDEEEEETRRKRRREKKRRREDREEEDLDEEDLDLIGQLPEAAPPETKFKRLKRGNRDDGERRGVNDIFADEDMEDVDDRRRFGREIAGEFDDFIEEDEFPDEERDRLQEELEVSRRPKAGLAGLAGGQLEGLDEADLEDLRAAFGDGTEYDWALMLQEAMQDDGLDPEKPLELKDVFEPSQLADKMLTDDDNVIRQTDIPERLQLARQPFPVVQMTGTDALAYATDEAAWISNFMWPKKRLDSDMREPFQLSVRNVLQFLNYENMEPPFIFHHRRDYLIHQERIPRAPDPENPRALAYEVSAEKLLDQDDLWEILELDLKYRALLEKREALRTTYDTVKAVITSKDQVVEDMMSSAVTVEEVQDILDYLHFQYAAELRDAALPNGQVGGGPKRARPAANMFERIRASKAYNVVRAFGVTSDAFAQSALEQGRRGFTDDPLDSPEALADQNIEAGDYATGDVVLRAAKTMFAEELVMSPRMRKLLRQTFYSRGVFDCRRTEKGLRKIDEDHPYYEFKYLRNQDLSAIARRPELFLRMMQAESEGLIEVHFRLEHDSTFRRGLVKSLESDNFSEVADAWNQARREVLNAALKKLEKIIIKGVKENLKTECEKEVVRKCKEEFIKRVDQAPFKPRGWILGTEPKVLAMTCTGTASANRQLSVTWAVIDVHGRCSANGRFTEFQIADEERGVPNTDDVDALLTLLRDENAKPDVIAISGFSVEAKTILMADVQALVISNRLEAPMALSLRSDDEHLPFEDKKLPVIFVNDEVARLYHTSDRASVDLPGLDRLTKYCVALGRYMQSPLKEYVALGRDLTSISFDSNQSLVSQDKLVKQLETAIVDIVNLVGVDINAAVSDPYVGNLLPYICGFGPRKAMALSQVVNRNGGEVAGRDELVGDAENNKAQAVGPTVWLNSASFLIVPYDKTDPTSNPLDQTRIHPEDYELANKMAADALDIDEEDIKAEIDEYGSGAVVRRLLQEDSKDKVHDLLLEEYADQLERNFNQRKRATLETIKAELQEHFEELRNAFVLLTTDEIFTVLTGETTDSLQEGMVVPVSVKKVFTDHMEVKLDCGIEGSIVETKYPSNIAPAEARQAFPPHHTIQAKLLSLDRRRFTAQLSLKEEELSASIKKDTDHQMGEWDDEQENTDKRESQRQTAQVAGKSQRVIRHPLFHPFNRTQAEEFLGPQARGEVVIRPSGKGTDHITVTWKVADNVFQHIDVLELDKENEFSVGRVLKIGGKYTYSDLDELIVNHVKAMARKVDEISTDDRFQLGTDVQTEAWLQSYLEANPRRAMYAFCINRQYPGHFMICFKAGVQSKTSLWSVKIVPNAFELKGHQ